MTAGTDTYRSRSKELEGRPSSGDDSGLGHDCALPNTIRPSKTAVQRESTHVTAAYANWGARPLSNQGDVSIDLTGL